MQKGGGSTQSELFLGLSPTIKLEKSLNNLKCVENDFKHHSIQFIDFQYLFSIIMVQEHTRISNLIQYLTVLNISFVTVTVVWLGLKLTTFAETS